MRYSTGSGHSKVGWGTDGTGAKEHMSAVDNTRRRELGDGSVNPVYIFTGASSLLSEAEGIAGSRRTGVNCRSRSSVEWVRRLPCLVWKKVLLTAQKRIYSPPSHNSKTVLSTVYVGGLV